MGGKGPHTGRLKDTVRVPGAGFYYETINDIAHNGLHGRYFDMLTIENGDLPIDDVVLDDLASRTARNKAFVRSKS